MFRNITDGPSSNGDDGWLSGGKIAAIVIGAILGGSVIVAAIAAAIFFGIKQYKKWKRSHGKLR